MYQTHDLFSIVRDFVSLRFVQLLLWCSCCYWCSCCIWYSCLGDQAAQLSEPCLQLCALHL